MTRRAVVRIASDGTVEDYADVGATVPRHLNDLVVDGAGRAYLSPLVAEPTPILLVDADGAVREVGVPLEGPNGMTISGDGRVLSVCESGADRLTRYDVADDGSLHNRRIAATFDPETLPDGAAEDASGTWVALALGRTFVRVGADGRITDQIPTGDRGAIACALGGDDGRTLFGLTCNFPIPRFGELVAGAEVAAGDEALFDSRIEAYEVEHPRAGWP
jgi:sugar lactone lactonase YvrE